MKIKVLQRSTITRYAGRFSSLSALRLCPAPRVEDRERGEQEGHGELRFGENGLSFTYTEEGTGIAVTVQKAGDALTVTRGGALLSFRLGAQTAFSYRTAYGEVPMEVYTEQLTLREREDATLLTLVYSAVLGDMAQKNEMRFKITKA